MFTLRAGETLAGVAGSASAINYTLTGDDKTISTAADDYGTLGSQGQLPAASATIFGPVSAGHSALVQTMFLSNATAGAVTCALFINGTTTGTRMIASFQLEANGFAILTGDGWKNYDSTGKQLFVGSTGAQGIQGIQGEKGWSPILSVVTDGARRVLQITSWVGGAGTPPSSTNQFLGAAGIVATAALAVDVRGAAGVDGTSPNAFTTITGNTGTATADAPNDTLAITGANGATTAATDTPDGLVITAPNGFSVVTGNTGTATADSGTDTLAITGTGAISTTATDTPDGLVIIVNPNGVGNTLLGQGAANTMKGNPTSTLANEQDVALTANTFLARASTGDIAAKTITDPGLSWLILTSIAAQTAALNAATAALKGLMSAQDKIRMGAQFDAQADLNYVGDLLTTNSTSSCSTGTPNQITDSASPFTPFADPNYYVGKRITLAGAGASGAVYVGTITAVAAGTATVTPNISTTVSNRIASFGTDNTAAITATNTLINTTNALFPGIRLIFGMSLTNAYGFPIPVLANKTAQVEGIGSGYTADTGDYSRLGGTRLAWWGTSVDGGVAFGAFWTFSPTGVQSLKRPAMRRLWLDCRNGDQNSALIGLKMASCQGWILDEFFVMDPGAIGLWFDIATSPTEARDCTRGVSTGLGFRCLDNTSGPVAVTLAPTTTSSAVSIAASTSLTLAAVNGLRASGSDYIWVQSTAGRPFLARYTGGGGTTTLTGVVCSAEDAVHVPTTAAGSNVVQASPANSSAIYLNGGSGANTCCNTFLQTEISHAGTWGPAAVDFGNSDSNNFQSCYINGGTRAVFGAAPNNRMTKPGVRFNGSNVSNTLASRNNTFTGGDPGSLPTTNGGVENMGLTNAGALLVAPAGPNYWDMYQLGNGAPMPVVEQGASFFWTSNGGFREGGLNSLAANHALTAAVANVVNGCWVVVPPQGWQIGTRVEWDAYLGKTAVGTAWTMNIRQHSALTAGGGTLIATAAFTAAAAIDEGHVHIDFTCTSLGGSGTALARYRASQNVAAATAGLWTGVVTPATVPVLAAPAMGAFEGAMTMAAFNTAMPSGGPTFLFLEIVPTTAATVMTVQVPSGLKCVKHANP